MITDRSSFFLDTLRIISAELVLIAHFTDYHQDHYLRVIFKDAGVLSVGVFFILSGLLISNSVWNKKSSRNEYRFKDYFFDRFFRIYTAFVPSLIVGIAIDLFATYTTSLPLSNCSVLVFAGNLFMLQEYPVLKELSYILPPHIGEKIRVPVMGSNLPLWPMAIEWWIYMLFGWIMFRQKSRNRSYWLVLIFVSIVPLYQIFPGSRMGPGLTLFWVLGMVIAILIRADSRKLTNMSESKLLTIISLILLTVFYGLGYWRLAIVFVAFIVFQLLKRSSSDQTRNKTIDKIIRTSANYSFTLYLTHFPILRFMSKIELLCSVEVKLLLNFVICNVLALIVAFLFETRHKALKAYWLNLQFEIMKRD